MKKISTLKVAWKYLTGGFAGVADYLLGQLNATLAALPANDRERAQGALNVALRVANTLEALSWLCPTKWQAALRKTVGAARNAAFALGDLTLTREEVATVSTAFAEAYRAWLSPDDETCVDGACED